MAVNERAVPVPLHVLRDTTLRPAERAVLLAVACRVPEDGWLQAQAFDLSAWSRVAVQTAREVSHVLEDRGLLEVERLPAKITRYRLGAAWHQQPWRAVS